MAEISGDGKGFILVGVDGSEASINALRWAAQQAKITESPLKVLMTWEFPISYGWMPAYSSEWDPEKDAGRDLDLVISEVLGEDSGIEVIPLVCEGHPSPILLRESEGASLLVVGNRGHGGFSGLLIGSVSEYLVTHAKCPVAVIRYFNTN